mmetsp:Transcript_64991/g.121021  ORF Transcript_64991/g.121021 Transcript_64991/m.121021 type:complete len:235 (+) Transcript_64991:1377-2081(+)
MQLKGATCVKTIPSEPQEERANDAEWDTVWTKIRSLKHIFKSSITRADATCTTEGSHTSDHVHEPGASKVHVRSSAEEGTAFRVVQEALTAPSPKDYNWIDHTCHDENEDAKCQQLRSLGNGAADNRRCRCTKCPLEEPLAEEGGVVKESIHHPLVRAYGYCPAAEVPAQKATSHDQQVLSKDILCVLLLYTASFQQAETRMHEEHEHRSKKHPNGIQALVMRRGSVRNIHSAV